MPIPSFEAQQQAQLRLGISFSSPAGRSAASKVHRASIPRSRSSWMQFRRMKACLVSFRRWNLRRTCRSSNSKRSSRLLSRCTMLLVHLVTSRNPDPMWSLSNKFPKGSAGSCKTPRRKSTTGSPTTRSTKSIWTNGQVPGSIRDWACRDSVGRERWRSTRSEGR